MDFESFWKNIFSEDDIRVRMSWDSLAEQERVPVRELLTRIQADPERIAEQRQAAAFALNVIAGMAGPDTTIAPAPAQSHLPVVIHQPASTVPDGVLDFARELASAVGERLKYASGQLISSTKKDGTLVTASDIEADQHMGEAIQARFPGHGVLSEEGEKVYYGQEWCWVVDPIDGTTNFTWGFPCWGVLIALLHDGQPVLGVAEFPPLGHQFYAVQGQGAWRKTMTGYGDGLIHTAVDTSFTTTQLFAVGTRSLKLGPPDVPCKLRLIGSTGFDFAALASGACVGTYDTNVHVWDIAALWPILEEAGARIVTNHPDRVFPLQAGVDYSSVSFDVLGASTPELLADSLKRLADRFIAKNG